MPTAAATALAILGLALLFDCVLGEYPAVVHPVVWLGKATSACLRFAPSTGPHRQLLFGFVLTVLIVGISASLAWLIVWSVAAYPIAEIMIGGFLLKASFALRALGQAAKRVVRPLRNGDLTSARIALRALCGRDAGDLDSEEIMGAVIESLAENASDSFVAPLCFYAVFGVPGAVAYRAVNTLDAMIGYRGKFEFLGKCAARLDDLANFLPARLTALLFLATGWLVHGNVRHGWRILRRDGGKTASPNAGRPMAAMAGLLDVRLDKKGSYSLGEPHAPITAAKVTQAWRMVVVSAVAMIGICALGVWAQ